MNSKEITEKTNNKLKFMLFLVQNVPQAHDLMERDDVEAVKNIIYREVHLKDFLDYPIYLAVFCGMSELALRKKSLLYRMTFNNSFRSDFCKISMIPMYLEVKNKIRRNQMNRRILEGIAEKYDFNEEKFKKLEKLPIEVIK